MTLRALSVFVIANAAVLSGLAQSAEPETGAERAERLLAAMGGREAWAQVNFVHVTATHDDLAVRDPFTNEIWNDFSAPRVRFEARNAALDSRAAINGDAGWRWRNGERSPMTPERFASEHAWWESNIYRTLHRLALRDPALTPRAVGANRLDIFRADGRRLNWFILHPSGAPMIFGTWDSEAGTTVGPLSSNGAVKYPRWGARPDGDFRYEIARFETSAEVPSDALFSTPDSPTARTD